MKFAFYVSKIFLTGETVEVKRGFQTIVNSSIKRIDGIHNIVSELESITVHSECRKSYTRESSILANKTKSPVKLKQLRSASSVNVLPGFDWLHNGWQWLEETVDSD